LNNTSNFLDYFLLGETNKTYNGFCCGSYAGVRKKIVVFKKYLKSIPRYGLACPIITTEQSWQPPQDSQHFREKQAAIYLRVLGDLVVTCRPLKQVV